MERRKALLAATIAAGTLVAGSFAYAATNLATAHPDNVGKLQSNLSRPVQIVYDDVPLSAPPANEFSPGSAGVVSQQGVAASPRQTETVGADDDGPGRDDTSFDTTGSGNGTSATTAFGGNSGSDDSGHDETDDRFETNEPDEHDDDAFESEHEVENEVEDDD